MNARLIKNLSRKVGTVQIELFLKGVVNSVGFRFNNVDWKDFAQVLLGAPSGARSSLFVNEATGQALKTLCMTLVKQGLFS